MNSSDNISKQQRLWQVIQEVPAGKVASYGQIAELAGLAGAARLVGNTLKKLPKGTQLPWHRIINAQGKISFPSDSAAYREQKQRLETEGVIFDNERITLSKYRWQP